MFTINGIDWRIKFCKNGDERLMRSDGTLTVGVTDWNSLTVYLSNKLHGSFLRKVMAHELVHCFCFSYDIHMSIEEEEFMADWISLYGTELVYLLDDIMMTVLRRIA